MAGGILSKGIKLAYKASGDTYTNLADLQEVPALGGTTESVETTTLDDAAHTYIDGILNYGDNLAFKFLYKKAQFDTLVALEGEKDWKVILPDESACAFSGGCSVQMDAVTVNGAFTYTLNIKPASAMEWQ